MHDVLPWLSGGAFFLAFASFLLASWACKKTVDEISHLESLKQINASSRERIAELQSNVNSLQREIDAHGRRLDREMVALGMEPGVYREEVDKESGTAKWVKSQELERIWEGSGKQMSPFRSAVDIARQP